MKPTTKCDMVQFTEWPRIRKGQSSMATTAYERSGLPVLQIRNKPLFPMPDHCCGARESVAVNGLHRLTHQRPASATNRDSRRGVGEATAARSARDGVTGSARTDRLHPSGHLACGTSDAGHRWSRAIPPITLPKAWRNAK